MDISVSTLVFVAVNMICIMFCVSMLSTVTCQVQLLAPLLLSPSAITVSTIIIVILVVLVIFTTGYYYYDCGCHDG